MGENINIPKYKAATRSFNFVLSLEAPVDKSGVRYHIW